jgi:hypothetical protein
MGILRRVWAGWKAFAHILGKIQTTILLTLVYCVAIGPISLLGRLLRRDLLALRRSGNASYWVQLPQITSDTERARKQF